MLQIGSDEQRKRDVTVKFGDNEGGKNFPFLNLVSCHPNKSLFASNRNAFSPKLDAHRMKLTVRIPFWDKGYDVRGGGLRRNFVHYAVEAIAIVKHFSASLFRQAQQHVRGFFFHKTLERPNGQTGNVHRINDDLCGSRFLSERHNLGFNEWFSRCSPRGASIENTRIDGEAVGKID